MTDTPTTTRPAPLPAEHRDRVLALLREVGITAKADNFYVAHNGVVRVKVERMTEDGFLLVLSTFTRAMFVHDWWYGISRAEMFIEDADELRFEPAGLTR